MATAGEGEGGVGWITRGATGGCTRRANVGEDGRGHYGNHGWGFRAPRRRMVWVMFRALEWISLALLLNGVSQC